jgi:hypothetical protein
MPNIGIDQADANELAELLQLLTGWLTADGGCLGTSLTSYLDSTCYTLDQLRNDLSRFQFLLGGNDGESLFGL